MRELRVEHALLYLDQIRVEFETREHIYDEFLDIVKTFNAKESDTPATIRRVFNLFQGNKELVLGFNTLLPEEYEIQFPPDGEGPPVAIFRTSEETITYKLNEMGTHTISDLGTASPVASATITSIDNSPQGQLQIGSDAPPLSQPLSLQSTQRGELELTSGMTSDQSANKEDSSAKVTMKHA